MSFPLNERKIWPLGWGVGLRDLGSYLISRKFRKISGERGAVIPDDSLTPPQSSRVLPRSVLTDFYCTLFRTIPVETLIHS
jgi:hypothetical protein